MSLAVRFVLLVNPHARASRARHAREAFRDVS